MEPRSFLDLSIELREQIYNHLLDEPVEGYLETAFLTRQTWGPDKFALITGGALSAVNKQIRAEISFLLRIRPIGVIALVEDFDAWHVRGFLTSLSNEQIDEFKMRSDRSCAKLLTLKLCGKYDDGWYKGNLEDWIAWVNGLAPITGTAEDVARTELATAHKVIDIASDQGPPVQNDSDSHYNKVPQLPFDLIRYLKRAYESSPPGPGKLELSKILRTMRDRHRAELMKQHANGVDALGSRFDREPRSHVGYRPELRNRRFGAGRFGVGYGHLEPVIGGFIQRID